MRASSSQLQRVAEVAQRAWLNVPFLEQFLGARIGVWSKEQAGEVLRVLSEIERIGVPANRLEAARAFRDAYVPPVVVIRFPAEGEDPFEYLVDVLGLSSEPVQCPRCHGSGSVVELPHRGNTWRTLLGAGERTGVGRVALFRKFTDPPLSMLRLIADRWFNGDLTQAALLCSRVAPLFEVTS